MTWTLNDIKDKLEKGKIRGFAIKGGAQKVPSKSKYGNEKTEVDGEWLDSKKEAMRFKALQSLLKAGKIGHMERQVSFELNEGGTHSVRYVADFVYLDMETGEKVVEDVKGMRTKVYLKKKKLMLKVHGIKIKEV